MGIAALLQASSPMPALHPWLNRYSKELSARMGMALEMPLRLRLDALTEEHPTPLLTQLEETGYYRRLEQVGSNDGGILQLDTDLAGWFVSRLFGSTGSVSKLSRELTVVEVEVLSPLTRECIDVLNESLREFVDVEFTTGDTETSTSLARRLFSTAALVVARFVVTVGDTPAGSLRLGLPARWMASLERRLARPSEPKAAGRKLITVPQMHGLPIELVVETAPLRTTAGVLAALAPGNKLRLAEDPSRAIYLKAGGEIVAEGRPTVRGTKKGLLVSESRLAPLS